MWSAGACSRFEWPKLALATRLCLTAIVFRQQATGDAERWQATRTPNGLGLSAEASREKANPCSRLGIAGVLSVGISCLSGFPVRCQDPVENTPADVPLGSPMASVDGTAAQTSLGLVVAGRFEVMHTVLWDLAHGAHARLPHLPPDAPSASVHAGFQPRPARDHGDPAVVGTTHGSAVGMGKLSFLRQVTTR